MAENKSGRPDLRALAVEQQAAVALRTYVAAVLGAEDEGAFADAVEGETSFNETVIALARRAREAEAFSLALQTIIDDNKARKERFERRAEVIRRAIANAMLDVGLRQVPAPDMTVSARIGASKVNVVSEELLPAEFWREIVTREPNKTKIKASLDEGRQVPGAVLSNGQPLIMIRAT
jgi:hypothetical protein